MKKVLNKLNAAALQKLSDDFVFPLIVILECAKKEGTTLLACSSFKALPLSKNAVISAALQQIVVPKGNVTLSDACDALLNDLNVTEVVALRKTFEDQTYQLRQGNYSLPVVNFKASVKFVFSHCIYTVLFDNAGIWAALKLPQLKREDFHDNFRADNDYPASCPYCDMDTINSRGSIKVEHFLPKSKFPLLSVHPLNLLSACESCNSGGFGKGSKVSNDLVCPYFEEIADSLDFDFDYLTKTVSIDAQAGKSGAAGFLDLLNLKIRYEELNVGIQVFRRMDAFVSTMTLLNSKDISEIQLYFEEAQGGAPFTIGLRYWLDNIYIPAKGLS